MWLRWPRRNSRRRRSDPSRQMAKGRCRRDGWLSHRAGEERIGHPLGADAGTGAVAADEVDIVAEWQQFSCDRLDQRGVTAAGQIGASDRAAEQHVADMRETQFLIVEHNTSRRMAGAMQDVEGQFADGNLLAFIEPAIGPEIAHAGPAAPLAA